MKKVRTINGDKLGLTISNLYDVMDALNIRIKADGLLRDEILYKNIIGNEVEYFGVLAFKNKSFKFCQLSINSVVVRFGKWLVFIEVSNRKDLLKSIEKYKLLKVFV